MACVLWPTLGLNWILGVGTGQQKSANFASVGGSATLECFWQIFGISRKITQDDLIHSTAKQTTVNSNASQFSQFSIFTTGANIKHTDRIVQTNGHLLLTVLYFLSTTNLRVYHCVHIPRLCNQHEVMTTNILYSALQLFYQQWFCLITTVLLLPSFGKMQLADSRSLSTERTDECNNCINRAGKQWQEKSIAQRLIEFTPGLLHTSRQSAISQTFAQSYDAKVRSIHHSQSKPYTCPLWCTIHNYCQIHYITAKLSSMMNSRDGNGS